MQPRCIWSGARQTSDGGDFGVVSYWATPEEGTGCIREELDGGRGEMSVVPCISVSVGVEYCNVALAIKHLEEREDTGSQMEAEDLA